MRSVLVAPRATTGDFAGLFEKSDKPIPIRAHDLWGTFVTLTLANGKTETWGADHTGHKSSAMTPAEGSVKSKPRSQVARVLHIHATIGSLRRRRANELS